MEWVLILYIYVGTYTLTHIPMTSEQACRNAGDAASEMVKSTTKNVRYVCVKTK